MKSHRRHRLFFRRSTFALAALACAALAFAGEIHDAARAGDLTKVTALLEANPDLISSKDNEGAAPLHLAALNHRKEVAEFLLARNADVNAKTSSGVTPLMLASNKGDLTIATLLISAHADVSAKTLDGATALILASQGGYPDVVRALLDKGADVNAASAQGSTALLLASGEAGAYTAVVQALLGKGAKVNIQNSYGATPLMLACKSANLDVVKAMLAAGADVKAAQKNGGTALMMASQTGSAPIVQALLDHGANVNAKDYIGQTPLHIARTHPDVADILRRAGGQDIRGNPASLIKATFEGHDVAAKEVPKLDMAKGDFAADFLIKGDPSTLVLGGVTLEASLSTWTPYGPLPGPSGGMKWCPMNDDGAFVILEVQVSGLRKVIIHSGDNTWVAGFLDKGAAAQVAVPVQFLPCSLEMTKVR